MRHFTRLSGLLILLLLFCGNYFAADKYWVKGSGSWHDPMHWSATSGGPGGSSIPALYDNVIIDENSFSEKNQYILISGEAYCNNLQWEKTGFSPVLRNKNNSCLTISGSLMIKENIINEFNGNIIFNSENALNAISSVTQFHSNLIFNGKDGSWKLKKDLLTTANIRLKQGTLETNDFNISCNEFNGCSDLDRSLFLGSSTIAVDKWDFSGADNLHFDCGTSRIILRSGKPDPVLFHFSKITYHSITVENTRLISSLDITCYDVKCNGDNNGSVAVTVNGGTGPFTFDWFPKPVDGDGTDSIYNLGGGPYTVVVTDESDGTWTWASCNVEEPDPISPTIIKQHVNCYGECNGQALALVLSGGTPPFEYLWSDPASQTDAMATGLCAGIFSVTITDSEGCSVVKGNIEITEPELLVVTKDSTNVLCSGDCSGTITLTPSGGTTPYSYEWSHDAGLTDSEATGLCAGWYKYTVTDDHGCIVVDSVNITDPIGGSLNIDSESSTDVTPCNGDDNGTVSVSASGGTGILTYDIGIPPTNNDGNFTDLDGGVYVVTVTDENGCTGVTNPIVVGEPDPIIIDSESATDVLLCYGDASGTVTVTSTGGDDPITYDIGYGPQGTGDFINLPAGDYQVTVEDVNGCTQTSSILTVNEPAELVVDSTQHADLLCNGDADGTIIVYASGGTGSLWYNIGLGPQGSNTFNNLGGGTYTVTVTDDNGCTAVTNPIVIDEPSGISIDSEASTDVAPCNGDANGTVTVAASGGTGILTYDIGIPPTNNDGNFTGLSGGTYTVTITDENGCSTVSNNIIVDEPPGISIDSESSTDVADCFGDATGTVSVSASGGTGILTYDIGIPPTNNDGNFTGLPAGTYTVTVTDENGCTQTSSELPVNEPSEMSIDTEASTDVDPCFGDANGTVTVTASGGTGSLSYDLGTGPQGNGNFTGLSGGSYFVTVTDENGCTEVSSELIVDEPPLLTVTLTGSSDETCPGDSDGTITVSASGGQTPYTYDLGIPPTNNDGAFTGLPAGSYIVTVTDDIGCTGISNPITINAPPAISINSEASTDVDPCFGDANGTVTVSASGGTGILTYDLGIPPTNNDGNFTGLSGGIYTVTITDENGCSVISNPLTVNEPTEVTIDSEASSDVTPCNGDANGTVTVTASGGTGVLTYDIGIPPTNNDGNFTGLSGGSYYVTVTDENGCSDISSELIVNEPTEVVIGSEASTDVDPCNGDANGTVTVSASGGTGILTYDLGIPPTNNDGNFTGLSGGTYTVTVTDENGCSVVSNPLVVGEPTAISIDSETSTDVINCFGDASGTVTVTASGGTGSLSYNIGSGPQGNGSFTNLIAGDYQVTVTDQNGCTQTSSVLPVNEPSELTIDSEASSDVTPCNGDANGTVTVTASGGTGVLTYDIGIPPTNNDGNFTGLSGGSYYVTVTDENGCSDISSELIVDEPALLTVTLISSADETCPGDSDGTITVEASGGQTPYTYDLGVPPTNTDGIFTGLAPDTYTVTVTDDNGCTGISNQIIIGSPDAISIDSEASTDIQCFGDANGTVTVAASGGTGILTYDIGIPPTNNTGLFTGLSGGSYIVTVTDANGCSVTSSPLDVNEPPELTSPITDTVMSYCGSLPTAVAGETFIPDGDGESYFTTITHTDFQPGLTLTDPAHLKGVLVEMEHSYLGDLDIILSCPNGSSVALKEGMLTVGYNTPTWEVFLGEPNEIDGADPYDPLQNPAGLGYNYRFTMNDDSTMVDAADVYHTLPPGDYLPYESFANFVGCPLNGDWTMSVTDSWGIDNGWIFSWQLHFDPQIFPEGYCTGMATVTPAGGSPPYTYIWSHGETDSTVTDLCAGTYTVTVIDLNGCTSTATVEITDTATYEVNITDSTMITCNGDCDGTAVATAVGGTPPYDFEWSDPAGTTNDTVTDLCAGWYFVTLTDATGCTRVDSVNITEPGTAFTHTMSYTNITCFGDNDGSATITPSGGSTPYTYVWSVAGTNSTITGLSGGMYYVTATDNNGCSVTDSAQITEPALLEASITDTTHVDCYGNCNGIAIVTPVGGSVPWSYLWSDSQTDSTAASLCANTYTVTVSDDHGCDTIVSVTITQPAEIITSITGTNAACSGVDNGTAILSISGGETPYSFEWSNGESTQNISGLAPMEYFVTVTDDNGCTMVDSITINADMGITLAVLDTTHVTCFGDADGAIDINASGSLFPPITYEWSNGETTDDISGLGPGTYTVTATDQAGCTAIDSATVLEPSAITIDSGTHTDITCNGDDDGTITISASGGTGSLEYDIGAGTQGTGDFTGLSPATYTITITDTNGCTKDSSITITEPAAIVIDSVGHTDISCYGETDGEIIIYASGGAGSLEYNIDGGIFSSDSSFTGLDDDTFDFTIQDGNGCTKDTTITITEPAEIVLSTDNDSSHCLQADGLAMVIVESGGVGELTYLWDDPASQTNDTASGLTAGTYTVTVTDENGCTAVATTIISDMGAASLSFTDITHNDCYGDTSGQATVVPSGGSSPYDYNWSSAGQTTETAYNLAADTYYVTVTDDDGCITTDSITITEPTQITVDSLDITDVGCSGDSDGEITIYTSGGTGVHQYAINSGTFSGTNTFTGLSAGTDTITIQDENGCTRDTIITIGESSPVIIDSASHTDLQCYGDTDGTIDVYASGGTPPLNYNIGAGDIPTGSFTDLSANTYTITITDSHGCTSDTSITVTQPEQIVLDAVTDSSHCNQSDGSATVSVVSGGTPDFTYLWNTGQDTSAVDTLASGNYIVTVTDANGCSDSISFTIYDIGAGTVSFTDVVHNQCFGDTTGQAIAVITGGQEPYIYLWSDSQTDSLATDLAAGTYYVTITDGDGCDAISSVEITEPSAIAIDSAGITNAGCSGESNGEIIIYASGGTGALEYSLNGGTFSPVNTFSGLAAGADTITIQDENGCTKDTIITISESSAITITSGSHTDLNCYNDNSGTIDITADGGTPPLNYNIGSGDQLTGSFTGLSANTYTVTITDDYGCTKDTTITVTEPEQIILSVDTTSSHCTQNDGAATVSVVSGGTPDFTYLWPDGQDTSTVDTLYSGSYVVTVTDANGCSDSISFAISDMDAGTLSFSNIVHNDCYGDTLGQVTVEISGGIPDYIYHWSDGQTDSTAVNLPAGTYSVSVTDADGCLAISSVDITEPPAIIIDSTDITGNCSGEDTGEIIVYASGGTGTLLYSIDGGAYVADSVFSDLTTGLHTISIIDDNLCTLDTSFSTSESPAITIDSGTHTDVTCYGDSTGTISVTASGGEGALQYTIDGLIYQPDGDFSGLAASGYTVTITDDNGCTTDTSITITQPEQIVLDVDTTSSHCNQSDGAATVSVVSGGTPGFTYAWSTGQDTSTVDTLSSGTYTVTVTDANGCSDTIQFSITDMDAATLTFADTVHNNCYGDTMGQVTVTPSGGTPDYTYLWSDGQTDSTAVNLGADTYTVTVTDADGCVSISSIDITEPEQLLVDSINTIDILCNGQNNGKIFAYASGGTDPLWYSIDGGDDQESGSFVFLDQGDHTITITDSLGCTRDTTVTIIEPLAINIDTLDHTDLECYGDTDGTIYISASGGTGSLEYTLDGLTYQSDGNFTGLAGGDYAITVTDMNGCTQDSAVTIYEPGQITLVVITTPSTCDSANGSGTISVISGGTPSFSYLWPDGQTTQTVDTLSAGNYIVTVTDGNGCTATEICSISDVEAGTLSFTDVVHNECYGDTTGQAAIVISNGTPDYSYIWSNGQTDSVAVNLGADIYYVTVTDGNGCHLASYVEITEPEDFTFTVDITNADCAGDTNGEIFISATGGTGDIMYSLDGGDFQSTGLFDSLPAGSYVLTVQDENGCTKDTTVSVNDPASITIDNLDITEILCNSDSTGVIDLTASGGTGSLEYSIDGTQQSTGLFTDLPAGTYTITVTDINGCFTDTLITLTEPDPIVLSTDVVNSSCDQDDGSATVNVDSGGTPDFTYQWDEQAGSQTTQTATSLSYGNYYVTVTDANGCASETIASVSDDVADTVEFTDVAHNMCYGDSSGQVTANVINGTPDFTWIWSNGDTTATITDLEAGTYLLTVTDGNNCHLTSFIEITQPDEMILSFITAEPDCGGDSSGVINMTITGGTEPYGSILWSNDSTTQDISGLAAGTYYVTVTDDNGCTVTDSVTIAEPEPILITISGMDASCLGINDGYASIDNITGGTQPYSYLWSNNETTPDIDELGPDTYYVTITDENDCMITDSITISGSLVIDVSLAANNATCQGIDDGSISATPDGGTEPYTYLWSDNSTTQVITDLGPGLYYITVTDSNYCMAVDSAEVLSLINITLTITENDIDCFGDADGSAGVTADGGTVPYSYDWSNGPTEQNVADLDTGMYYVTVTDLNGCYETDSIHITQPEEIIISLSGTSPDCFGSDEGTVSVDVTGGIPPYEYLWSEGSTTDSISNLYTDTYYITVTDSNECAIIDSILISQPDSVIPVYILDSSTCNNTNDGSITISNISGGTPPFTYLWFNGDTIQTVDSLGAGTYSVTITDNNGCIYNDSATLSATIIVNAIAETDTVICFGDSVQITGSGGDSYSWWPPEGLSDTSVYNPYAAPDTSTSYILTVYEDICYATDTVRIEIYPSMEIDAGEDAEIYIDESIFLQATGGDNNTTWLWTPETGLTNPINPYTEASPEQTTTYYIYATSQYGCTEYDSVTISVIPLVFIPSGFSPNGDGVNDIWQLDYLFYYPEIEVSVYTRWGELLFHSKGYENPWDGTYKGKDMPAGTYYYVILLNDVFFPDPITGPVTIMR